MYEDQSEPVGSTPPPQTHKKRKWPVIILVILLILALAGAGYLYWLLKENKEQVSEKESQNSSLRQKIKQLEKTSQESQSQEQPVADDTVIKQLPVVIFTPGGKFTDEEKSEITTKLINPFKVWHNDNDKQVVSIHIQEHFATPAEYTVDVIYLDGSYEGFLYGTVGATTQEWWVPTCLEACEFSDSFKAAYPEIVAKANP